MQTITADRISVAQNPHGVDVRHLYAGPRLAVSQITLQPGEVVKPHEAPVDLCFYILEGAPLVAVDGESVEATAGTLIPSAAGHVHGVRNETDGLVRLLAIKAPVPKD